MKGLPEQITEASSLWSQFSTPHPLCWQSAIEFSLPEQPTLSSQIGPLPAPNRAEPGALSASKSNPSSTQTTLASFISQSSSQIVPQLPLWNISTLPSPYQLPPTSFNSKNVREVNHFSLIKFTLLHCKGNVIAGPGCSNVAYLYSPEKSLSRG